MAGFEVDFTVVGVASSIYGSCDFSWVNGGILSSICLLRIVEKGEGKGSDSFGRLLLVPAFTLSPKANPTLGELELFAFKLVFVFICCLFT